MTVKQLLACITLLTIVTGTLQASPTYWRITAASNPYHQNNDEPFANDAVPPVGDVDRRRPIDPPVSVAIPLPAAGSAAMITLSSIGLLMVVCRRRRLV